MFFLLYLMSSQIFASNDETFKDTFSGQEGENSTQMQIPTTSLVPTLSKTSRILLMKLTKV